MAIAEPLPGYRTLYRVYVRFFLPRMPQNKDCGRFMQTAWDSLFKGFLIIDNRDMRHDEGYWASNACKEVWPYDFDVDHG